MPEIGRTGPDAGLELRLIEDDAGLLNVAPKWRALAVACGNAFLTPEWYALSRLKLERATQPLLVVASTDGAPVGVLPLIRPDRGPARFAGVSLGDRFGPLVHRDAPDGTAQALLDLAREGGRTLSLDRVAAPPAGWDPRRSPGAVIEMTSGSLPVIDFAEGGWAAYLATRSRNLRSQVGRRRRKLEREHGVTLWTPGTAAEVDWGMAELFRLHGRRWSERSERSRFDRDDASNFHREFAKVLANHGWLRLLLLRSGEDVVAAWYGWRLGGVVSYYQAGYDPAWGDRGAGGVLFAASIEAAAEEGAKTYDMLLGDESFKLRWATRVDEATTSVLGSRRSPALWAAWARRAVRPAWRALPASVRSRVRP